MKTALTIVLIVLVLSAGSFGIKLINAQTAVIQELANELLDTQAALVLCSGGSIGPEDDIKVQEVMTDQSTNGRALASTMMW
jgi:hypothetical protein